jgi:hypothetical protein
MVSAGLRISRPSQARRRAAALVGVVAILFQAVFSSWHHHAHPLSLGGLSAGGFIVVANGEPVHQSADDDCPICFTLGHHTAVPIDFFAVPSADHKPLPLLSGVAVTPSKPSYLLFWSRAPPLA